MFGKEIKGFMTCAHTFFGRHYYAFRALEEDIKKHPRDHMDCLVIGPGYDGEVTGPISDIDDYIRTYQPFELANAMINAGLESFVINVVDISPEVLSEIRKSPPLMKVSEGFWRSHLQRCLDKEDNLFSYYDSFFPDCTSSSAHGYKIVQIPDEVINSIKTEPRDIIADGIPERKFDAVVCTTVMSYYFMQCFNNPEISDEGKRQMEKMRDSIYPGGYLITTEEPFPGKEWEILEYKCISAGSVHTESSGLYRRIE
ncbi:hypothetical protein GF345_03265 [Candidatus Woesearchaeota archaeon]|nr:hypothetical protein [Candidatus Woesearchaeota archaeon]